MLFSRTAPALNAAPVSNLEFTAAYGRAWSVLTKQGSKTALKHPASGSCAIAVSGGVDSIALAVLYRQSLSSWKWRQSPQHAFVVDHGARPGSSEEADRVVELLETRLGYKARKLKIQWPSDVEDPLQLSNFETQARKLRYRALGLACKDANVRMLLLGHHEDDRVETMFMRLARGGKRLQSFPLLSTIPHCYDLYGVYQSGISQPASSRWTAVNTHGFTSLPFEAPAGVLIARPLLAFSKDRLVATCRQYGLEWFEDATNTNQTLTERNAVRHINQHYKLPEALRKSNLLRSLQRYNERHADAQGFGTDLFNNAAMKLETRTGTLTMQFTSPRHLGDEPIPRLAFEGLMQMASSLVVDMNDVRKGARPREVVHFQTNADRLYNHLTKQSDSTPARFTSAKVQIDVKVSGGEWLCTVSRSRPPMRATEVNTFALKLSDSPENMPIFFDTRYWIRVVCESARAGSLVLRFLRQEDVPRLHLVEEKLRTLYESWPGISYILDRFAAGNIRYGLPVIALAERTSRAAPEPDSEAAELKRKDDLSMVETEVHHGRARASSDAVRLLEPGDVIALPTFGIQLGQCFGGEFEWLRKLRYEISYRSIDLGTHAEKDVIVDFDAFAERRPVPLPEEQSRGQRDRSEK